MSLVRVPYQISRRKTSAMRRVLLSPAVLAPASAAVCLYSTDESRRSAHALSFTNWITRREDRKLHRSAANELAELEVIAVL